MKIKHTRLEPWKMGQLITEWIYKAPARVAAQKLHLNRKTTDLWYGRIREAITHLPNEAFFSGEVEVDETYLSSGIAGQVRSSTADKVAVFGILERKTKRVWATVVPGTTAEFLLPPILKHVARGTTIYSDAFGAYRHLEWFEYRHRVVPHCHTYSRGYGVHSNGIESFWAYLQDLLGSRNGLPRHCYQAHVSEAVFRFNNRDPRKLRYALKRMLDSRD